MNRLRTAPNGHLNGLIVAWFFFVVIVPWSRALGQQPEVATEELPSMPLSGIQQSLASIEVADGFRIEPVAWEPLVVDPVAMAFDEWGRLFVVEMRDYSERRPERLGRVRLLEDRDQDGVMDHSSVYVDHLPWPTALACFDGGVFVGTTPDIIYCKDEDGDGQADRRETLFTGFASDYAPYETNRLNVQALMNSFRWGIDNRIHGVASGSGGKVRSLKHSGSGVVDLRGRDFSFDPVTLQLRAESGGAQHGMSFDDVGQKFVCSNSDHIQQVVYPYRYVGLNPRLPLRGPRISIADDGPAAPVYRLSGDEPWRVIRTKWRVAGRVGGPVEGGGRPSGYFTGATGVTIYRGDQWPQNQVGHAFIADCGSNLIHRKQIIPAGVVNVATRYPEDSSSEFVASRDNWFRPVQFANAPDGSLWVADMSREIIEHPWSLPANIKQHLDLNHGNQAGRLYRIASSEREIQFGRQLGGLSSVDLVSFLEHPNGWHRDTASRLLIERGDETIREPLLGLLSSTSNAAARIHMLYLLHRLTWLTEATLEAGLADASPAVRVHALRLLEPWENDSGRNHSGFVNRQVGRLIGETDDRVRFQLALSLGHLEYPDRVKHLYHLSKRTNDRPWLRFAVMNSVGSEMDKFWALVLEELAFWSEVENRSTLLELGALAGAVLNENAFAGSMAMLAGLEDRGLARALVLSLLEDRPVASSELSRLRSILSPLVSDAMKQVRDRRSQERQVAESIELLSLIRAPGLEETVRWIMDQDLSSDLMVRCLRVCRRLETATMVPWLEERFQRFLPQARREFLSLFFDRSGELERVLDWIDDGRIAVRELTEGQRRKLLEHTDKAVSERAGKVLAPPMIDATVAMEQFLPALLAEADLARGREIFVERCGVCHQIGATGADVGPSVVSMRGLRKRGMLEAILFPNQSVAPQYFGITVAGNDGMLTGILKGESDEAITLRQAGGTEATLRKATISSVRSEGMSLMPNGLLDGLAKQDVADLLEFLMYGEGSP